MRLKLHTCVQFLAVSNSTCFAGKSQGLDLNEEFLVVMTGLVTPYQERRQGMYCKLVNKRTMAFGAWAVPVLYSDF